MKSDETLVFLYYTWQDKWGLFTFLFNITLTTLLIGLISICTYCWVSCRVMKFLNLLFFLLSNKKRFHHIVFVQAATTFYIEKQDKFLVWNMITGLRNIKHCTYTFKTAFYDTFIELINDEDIVLTLFMFTLQWTVNDCFNKICCITLWRASIFELNILENISSCIFCT